MTLGNPRSVRKTIADVTSADRLRIYIDTSVRKREGVPEALREYRAMNPLVRTHARLCRSARLRA
jgi:hypothetical protein